LHECVTFSFCGEVDFARFGGSDLLLKLRNPISSALTHMRPSALPHLVEAARRNHDRGLTGIALFEVGPVYRSPATDGQRVMAAGVRLVETQRHWQGGTAPDAYTVKDDVLGALAASGVNIDNIQIVMSDHGWWHPGRSGRIQLGPKTVLAEFGQLHPDVTGDDFTLVGFEIDLDAIPERRARGTAKPRLDASDLMPVRRDFAFVVKDNVRAGDLTRAIVGADKALIEGASVFDIYRGKGLGEDEKSVAVEVTLQPREATLDDKALQAVSEAIIRAAEKAVGARLR
jgi:phenylalanyl-tRNA synthetase beta chain